MINTFVSATRRAKAEIVILSVTGVIFSVNWYDMMAAPLGGAA